MPKHWAHIVSNKDCSLRVKQSSCNQLSYHMDEERYLLQTILSKRNHSHSELEKYSSKTFILGYGKKASTFISSIMIDIIHQF